MNSLIKGILLIKNSYRLRDKALAGIFILLRVLGFRDPLLADIIVKNQNSLYYCRKNSSDDIGIALFHEESLKDLFRIPAGTFIDVGAHIGKHTVSAAKGNRITVLSVEASPDAYRVLRKNIRLNGLKNVIAVSAACWSKSDKLKLHKSGIHNSTSTNSIMVNSNEKYVIVDAVKLDDLVSKFGLKDIRLIKIDVEGAEAEVLKGAKETLRKFHPKILFEAWNKEYLHRVEEVLKPFNYTINSVPESKMDYLAI